MDERLALADAALKAGDRGAAISHLIAICTEEPAQPLRIYQVLVNQLYWSARYEEGEAWAAKATARFPREVDLLNLHAVILRNLGRQAEALPILDRALKLNPNSAPVQTNRGNILLDLGKYVTSEEMFTKLARKNPRNPEFQRQIGRALQHQGKFDQAALRFRQALTLKKDFLEVWLDLIAMYGNNDRLKEAEEHTERALEVLPGNSLLLEAKAVMLRRSGDLGRAAAFMQGLLPEFETAGWLHYQLGTTLSETDRLKGNQHLRRAIELAPAQLKYSGALIESLERTRLGDEGANIEEAYQLTRRALAQQPKLTPFETKIFNEVLIRVCAFDEIPQVGDFQSLGRGWAETGRHTALLKQLGVVSSDGDRKELLEQHQIWGRAEEQKAARNPIKRSAPRPKDGKIRLGFMSSDLRQHPVAYFTDPLFRHLDERFEIYCYSFYRGAEDPMQAYIRNQVKAFRWIPDMTSREVAQTIADDQLDILIELGGSTHMNRLEVMAYKPAPQQASWLGYPHSAGLKAIDYFICDPYSAPSDPALLMEKPLMLPHSWVALGRAVFSTAQPITETLPEDRNGYLTFGTANNPHKYTRKVLRTWAKVTAGVPNARFAFIRPEGGSESFRRNILTEFAAEGVDETRVVFHTVRGAHMPFYNEIDITLDPFPLTGGTTTTEALWMGVPVVSLRGKSFHERLSYSLLSNIGHGDLVGSTIEEYIEIAVKLANDKARRLDLHRNLRAIVSASPLGQTEAFAKDFYDTIANVLTAAPATVKA